MFQQTPESGHDQGAEEPDVSIELEPKTNKPAAEAEIEISPDRIKNPNVAEVEAYAEDMHRQFMDTFGQEQADTWLAEQRPALDAEIKQIEAIDQASDLAVIFMTQAFMKNTTEARKSNPEKPVSVLDSQGMKGIVDSTVATPRYRQIGAGILNTEPVAEDAVDKFSEILTGKKMSNIRQELSNWRNSPKFRDAPREGMITPSLGSSTSEYVRTNIPNVALSISPTNQWGFVYVKNIPGGVPTAEQFMKNCRKAAGEPKPEDFIQFI